MRVNILVSVPLLSILCPAMTFFAETTLGRTSAAAVSDDAGRGMVFIGTYTGGPSRGIYVSRMDAGTGGLSAPALAAETANPSFLSIHPNRRFLYAVSEINSFDGKKSGAVAAFAIDRGTGRLTLLNRQASGGTGPCHVCVDATGKCVMVANYGSGSVATLPVGEDGSLGEARSVIQHTGSSVNPQRQQGPHAHQIVTDAANRFAVVCDLGLDKVLAYRLDPAEAKLSPNDPPFTSVKPGSGPRHLAFHPSGRFAYVISELSSTLTTFIYDAQRGTLSEVQTLSTLPADFRGVSTTAEVGIHPSGKFVYGSNRGHDSISVFAIDEKTGKLSPVQHQPTLGKVPRFFVIDPTGKFLFACNQDSNNIVVFRIDRATGRLTPAGQTVGVGRPVCLAFLK